MTNLFQDMGVPDIITSDGSPEFKVEKFKSCMRQYGVHHRLTSVGFPHANTRSELAVKSAKRLLRNNMSPTGGLENVAVTRAVLTYRNTPGNQPLRWTKRGVVVQVLANRKNQVRLDGRRRLTLCNRKFLRKFTPIHENPSDTLQMLPSHVPVHSQQPHNA